MKAQRACTELLLKPFGCRGSATLLSNQGFDALAVDYVEQALRRTAWRLRALLPLRDCALADIKYGSKHRLAKLGLLADALHILGRKLSLWREAICRSPKRCRSDSAR